MTIPPWTTALRTTAPHEIVLRIIPPELLLPRQFPLNNSPLDNFPWTITLCEIPPMTIIPRNPPPPSHTHTQNYL